MEKRRSNILISFMVLATIFIGGLVLWSGFKISHNTENINDKAAEVTPNPDLTDTMEYPAPDGKMSLTVVNKPDGETIKQTFTVKNTKEAKEINLYQETVTKDNIITVPFNTFSPDDKYIFLKRGKEKPEYFVLRTDTQDLVNKQKTVNIVETFDKKYQDLVVSDVTGWGGINLIVVNSDTMDGKTGPSFWFDMSNLSFIRLTNRFN